MSWPLPTVHQQIHLSSTKRATFTKLCCECTLRMLSVRLRIRFRGERCVLFAYIIERTNYSLQCYNLLFLRSKSDRSRSIFIQGKLIVERPDPAYFIPLYAKQKCEYSYSKLPTKNKAKNPKSLRILNVK